MAFWEKQYELQNSFPGRLHIFTDIEFMYAYISK